jgi:hypothetical protein
MIKGSQRSSKARKLGCARATCHGGRRERPKFLSPLVLSSLIQAVSRIIVAFVS